VIAVAERIQASIANHRWRVDADHAGIDLPAGELLPARPREIQPMEEADILRGPHWHRTPAPAHREVKRPA
jgi:hypothetical protein